MEQGLGRGWLLQDSSRKERVSNWVFRRRCMGKSRRGLDERKWCPFLIFFPVPLKFFLEVRTMYPMNFIVLLYLWQWHKWRWEFAVWLERENCQYLDDKQSPDGVVIQGCFIISHSSTPPLKEFINTGRVVHTASRKIPNRMNCNIYRLTHVGLMIHPKHDKNRIMFLF